MSRFTVYDKHGNVWPPNFRSTLDAEDEKRAADQRMRAACNASAKARAEGKGWSNGTLQYMLKPLVPKKAGA